MSAPSFTPTVRGRRGKGLRTKSARLRAARRAAGITARTRPSKTPATVESDA